MNDSLSVAKNPKKYYSWIDYAKFLSILLVVFFHTPYPLEDFGGRMLGVVRMPMFFFLSGLLFKGDKYTSFGAFFSHRARQLLIPYVFFFFLFYFYWLLYGRSHGTAEDQSSSLLGPVWEYAMGVPKSFNVVMWFIPCLFLIQCLFFVFFRKMNRYWGVLLLVLVSVTAFVLDLNNLPFSFESVCYGLLYYGVAAYFNKDIIRCIEKKTSILAKAGLSFLLIAFIFVFFCIEPYRTLPVYLFQLILQFFLFFFILKMVRVVSLNLHESKFVWLITRNAVVVLAMHTYCVMFLHLVFTKVGLTGIMENFTFLYKLILSVISIVIMVIPIKLINRYIPFVLGKF